MKERQTPLIEIDKLSVQLGGATLLQDISFTLFPGQQWAITGESGSGKTTLALALCGKLFHKGTVRFHLPVREGAAPRILLVEQQHRFRNRSHTSDFYYQQRYNSSDAEDSQTVRQALGEFAATTAFGPAHLTWIRLLHLDKLLDSPLIQLSNGENKRLQLAEALLAGADLLILDNPFVGLDAEGRGTLQQVLEAIHRSGIPVLLICAVGDLPAGVTHLVVLQQGRLVYAGPRDGLTQTDPEMAGTSLYRFPDSLTAPQAPAGESFHYAVRMVRVSVRYGDRKVLDGIDWEVKRGEHWSISGPNGAGKSTLLSLISADNPQAYANEIYLFDKRRGKGESIWDIKRRIGLVSPELHQFFDRQATCYQVVGSGLFDTIGLFRPLRPDQERLVDTWLETLQLTASRNRPLYQLPLSRQRLALLARALVKQPPLLILDEPSQGMDPLQTRSLRSLIDQICERFAVTLLFVSHYPKDIPDCVTRFLRLENGRIHSVR
ncbi:MAG TPA: ATP-binding cassette domain-containing protein [Chitinophagaceae bacterium]|nr:ATP-binding cassette domain-containing protein [Chitinophagaceae bacterium]